MAKIVTIATNKGGCGKTTTAVALAAGLAAQGRRTLIVDIDGQANATQCLNISTAAGGCFEALKGQAVEPAPIAQNLWGLGSCIDMTAAEAAEGMENGTAIANMLKPYASRFDFIVIDTPPQQQAPTLNAIKAADFVIIPLQAGTLALQGLGAVIATLKRLGKAGAFGIVVTMYDRRKLLQRQVYETARQYFGAAVFSTPIRQGIAVDEAQAQQAILYEYAPKAKPAQDYMEVTAELLRRIG